MVFKETPCYLFKIQIFWTLSDFYWWYIPGPRFESLKWPFWTQKVVLSSLLLNYEVRGFKSEGDTKFHTNKGFSGIGPTQKEKLSIKWDLFSYIFMIAYSCIFAVFIKCFLEKSSRYFAARHSEKNFSIEKQLFFLCSDEPF